MTERRNPNEGSTDLPNYLRVSTERHKSSSPSGRSSKKVFPQLRHGVSPDAPIEFHNKNSILALSSAKSILLEDPAVKHEKPKKVLGKDKLGEWPMKYIYTTALDIEHVPHKIERKSVKPKELYDCILNESRVVQRPDMVIGEETLYTRRFYEAVRESKAFHRKKGYFENFANHHKTTNEDYKVRRSSSNGHTRYINKPIILTNLNSRNSMTSNGSQMHTSLLQDVQGRRPTLTPLVSEQSINKSHIDGNSASAKVQSQTQTLTQNQNDTLQLQQVLSKKEVSEKNSGSFMTHKNFYENYSKKGSTQQTPDFERTTRQSDAENSRLNTRRVKTIKRTRSIVADKPTDNSYAKSSRRDMSGDYTLKVDQTQSFQTGHNSIRYKTKEMTRLLSEQREQGIHVDPTVFVQHKVAVENKRDSDIKISVIDQRKRYSLATNGTPVKYICASYRGPTNGEEEETAEDTVGGNIAKFEKYIDRLRFTGKNFGHQRWFYDRNWKLEKHNAAL